jgi:type III pantothenate kinase
VTLLVDAGAAGLRWARLEAGRPAAVAVAAARELEPEAWPARLGELPAVPRVLVANTAGPVFEARFRAFSTQTWGVEPEFAAAAAEQLGLRNAYRRPGALGVDRWLAMLAAWRRERVPLVVATAGAAFTVDLVDGAGRHRGGVLVPGERLMREVLHAQTSGVAAASLLDAAAVDGVFGVNTAGAVQQGARLALAALVDRAAERLAEAAGRAPRVLLTGGAAEDVAPLVRSAAELAPGLVLEGLALLAAEGRA